MIVLIDGENLRHRLAEYLQQNKFIAPNQPFRIDIAWLLEQTLRTKKLSTTRYYTTRLRQLQPGEFVSQDGAKKSEAIIEYNRHWLAMLVAQQFTIIKAGHLKLRDMQPCDKCGFIKQTLQEKGVDVRLAVDLMNLSYENDKNQVVLLSSDSDLIPAIQAARRLGAKVTYLGFANKLNRALVAACDETVGIMDVDLLEAYRRELGDKNG